MSDRIVCDNIIEVNKLCCRVGKKYLLKDISWSVKPGEHWTIFGLNGSGKTTLLSILAGYKMQTDGTLKVFGESYNDDNLLAFRQRIGLVSASCFDRYYREESALQIVLSGLFGTLGLDFDISDENVKYAKKLLGRVGLGEKVEQSYASMSKGERESVLIARALISNPEILILDEPCSGLDVTARDRMLNTVENLARQGKMTIIYVTHYAEEVLDCFENALLLRNGKIYKKGISSEIFTAQCMSAFLNTEIEVKKDECGRLTIFTPDEQKIELYEGGELA